MDSVRSGPFGQIFRPDNFVFGELNSKHSASPCITKNNSLANFLGCLISSLFCGNCQHFQKCLSKHVFEP